jgi:hypothetical protein
MKKVIVFVMSLYMISCGKNIGYDDIEIKEENGLTVGYLKSDNSLFTGDIIEYYSIQSGSNIDSETGESDSEYTQYPELELHFEKGLASGVWRWYHDKGKIDTEISYKEGKYHGAMQEYDEFGDLILVEVWKDNELIFEEYF